MRVKQKPSEVAPPEQVQPESQDKAVDSTEILGKITDAVQAQEAPWWTCMNMFKANGPYYEEPLAAARAAGPAAVKAWLEQHDAYGRMHYGRVGRHCGCEDSTDKPWGAGGTPSHPVYCSHNREEWCDPVLCDENGIPL